MPFNLFKKKDKTTKNKSSSSSEEDQNDKIEEQKQNNNQKQTKTKKSSKKLKKQTSGNLGIPGQKTQKTQNTIMSTSTTTQRLQQLMQMRNGPSEKGDRSRSVNVNRENKKKGRHPKQRKTGVHKQDPRRHSMFPNDQQVDNKKKEYQNKKNQKKKQNIRKVQYRVKNEVFTVFDYYEPIRIIGTGAYAVVAEAIDTRSGRKVAIKKNKGVFDHITDARRILREIKLLMFLEHQDIISLIDVVPPDKHEQDTFNDVYLVMPKMETNLAKVIRSKQKLTNRHYEFFIYQMLRGLKYMHSANIIHRDLKPENILINGGDCNVKITDFGLARGVCKDEVEKPTEYVVTRWYRSPEVMCSAGYYDEKVDIWSVGCIMAELILRKPLFPGQNYLDQLKIIFEIMGTPKDLKWIKTPEAKRWVSKLKPHPGKNMNKIFDKVTPEARDLLLKMLKMNPDERISAVGGLEHEWLTDLHDETEEICSKPFDLSFEFEKSIKTKFGVRHMMCEALDKYKKDEAIALELKKSKKRKKKKHKSKQNQQNQKNQKNQENQVKV